MGMQLCPWSYRALPRHYCSGRSNHQGQQGTESIRYRGGPGHIPAMLTVAGFDIDVVDIAPERAAGLFKAMQIPMHKINVELEPLPHKAHKDNSRDSVIFSEILEHLKNQQITALKEIYRILRPGGYLLLSVPNITPLMRWQFLNSKDYMDNIIEEFKKIQSIGHMGHFRLYSHKEVSNILSHIGFRIIGIDIGGHYKNDDPKSIYTQLFMTLVPCLMRAQLYVTAVKPFHIKRI